MATSTRPCATGLAGSPYDVRKEFLNNKIYRIRGGPDSASFRAHKLEPSPEFGAHTQPQRWNERLGPRRQVVA